MFFSQRLPIDSGDSLLDFLEVHHVVLAFPWIVGRGEDDKLGREGVEHRRYGRKTVTAAGEVNVFLTQGQQELLHIYAVARTDVGFAVVEDQEAVDKISLDVFKYLLFSMADDTARPSVVSYSFRKTRMHHRNSFPFVLMRCDDKSPASFLQSIMKYLPQDSCLACAWLAHEHHLEDLTRLFGFSLGPFLILEVWRVHSSKLLFLQPASPDGSLLLQNVGR